MYGFTLAIVGMFDLIKKVGNISTAPPITIIITANTVKVTGFFSNTACQNSPFLNKVDFSKAGASAGANQAQGLLTAGQQAISYNAAGRLAQAQAAQQAAGLFGGRR